MRKHYYAHVLYYYPSVYEYEYIINSGDFLHFLNEIIVLLEDHYKEASSYDEIYSIRIDAWQDFLESNNIVYEKDSCFPHYEIWDFIKNKLYELRTSENNNDKKFAIMDEQLDNYLDLINDACIEDGDYLFQVCIFNNSRSFAEHFFQHLEDGCLFEKQGNILEKRINGINKWIKNSNFPNCDLHEGILSEWLTLYELLVGQ